jgi:hypothetical protein
MKVKRQSGAAVKLESEARALHMKAERYEYCPTTFGLSWPPKASQSESSDKLKFVGHPCRD